MKHANALAGSVIIPKPGVLCMVYGKRYKEGTETVMHPHMREVCVLHQNSASLTYLMNPQNDSTATNTT